MKLRPFASFLRPFALPSGALLAAAAIGLQAGGCARQGERAVAAPGGAGGIRFTDVAEKAGVRFRHVSGESGRLFLPETLGSGCAILDYNRDGRPDLFLVNSTRLPGYQGQGPNYSALYRNQGPGPEGFA